MALATDPSHAPAPVPAVPAREARFSDRPSGTWSVGGVLAKATGRYLPALFDELRRATHESTKHPEMQVGRVEGALLKMLVAD